MYESFYGLNERPFLIVPNPHYLYLSSKHKSALTYLEYGLTEDVAPVVLTGDIGTGKTTLIRYILKQFLADMNVAVIFNTNVSADVLLSIILKSFDLNSASSDKAEQLDALFQFLIQQYAQNRKTMLIIDEAQNLKKDCIEEVRMLSNLQSDDQMLLQIMLVGQPELKQKLNSTAMEAFSQRIAVKFHMTGLTLSETSNYIAHRLQKAGGTTDIFTPEAIERVFQTAHGIPRTINILCDAALVYGYGQSLAIIDAAVIKRVIEDKGIGLPEKPKKKSAASKTDKTVPAVYSDAIGNLNERIGTLENMLYQLKHKTMWQVHALEKEAEKYKDQLVVTLKQMLYEERRQNETLIRKNMELIEKCRQLSLVVKRSRIIESSPKGEQANASPAHVGRGWLKRPK